MGITSARLAIVGSIVQFQHDEGICCFLSSCPCRRSPKPEAEADAQFIAAAPYAAPAVVPAANCKTDVEVLVTQTCVPTAENVCTTQTVDTEEIEYEKVCKEVVDTICDQPAVVPAAVGYHAIAKREADAEADPQFLAAHPYGLAAAPLAAAPVAAVAPVAAHA